MVNALEKPVGINVSLILMVAVENIASEARNLLAIDNLRRARARLRILASHATNSHHSLVSSPDENHTHLQQELDLGLNSLLLAVVEQLSTVSALQQEGISLSDIAQTGLQVLNLIGVHQRRHAIELRDGLGELGFVWVCRRLLDGF